VLNYVMAYAEGSLQCPPRAPSPPLPPAHKQPPTPPVQQHVVVDVHTQDEQDPQAHERPQGGCTYTSHTQPFLQPSISI
jgi:hypothetical protein